MAFFKIDTKVNDLFVLQGFPWERLHPDVFPWEFDPARALSLRYDVHRLCVFLAGRGYSLLVNEWHPLLRHGIRHQVRRQVSSPAALSTP